MFSVQIKTLLAVSAISITAASCTTNTVDETEAQNLLSQSKADFEAGKYDNALLLLDSIDHGHPKAVNTRRDARLLRPQVLERQSASQLSMLDSLLVVNSIKGDSLKSCFTFVSNPVEGYYVAKETGNADVNTTAGLHSRISQDYHLYMVASCPQPVKSVSITATADGESVSTPIVAFDGERNSRNGKCEMITFTEAESAPIAQFIGNHRLSPVSITFNGENGKTYSMTLSQSQKNALSYAYDLIMAINADKTYRLETDRMRRQLEIARQQLANVSDK